MQKAQYYLFHPQSTCAHCISLPMSCLSIHPWTYCAVWKPETENNLTGIIYEIDLTEKSVLGIICKNV